MKTIIFDSDAKSISVFGGDAEGGCANGGFAMQCVSSDATWNGLQTDTSWKVLGNDGGKDVGTSCPAGWANSIFDDSSWQDAMLGATNYADDVVGVSDICGDQNSWCFRKQVREASKKKNLFKITN